MFKAAIFDLDGTLLDSMGVWKKIDIDFLAKRGLPVPETFFDDISALSARETAEYTIALFAMTESVDDLLREWHDMAIHEYSYNIRLKPFAKEYLEQLKLHKIKLGTATSLSKDLAEPVLRNNGIYHLFDILSFTDEVERGKKFPDIYLLAAQRLDVPPGQCVVFEDVPQGITSAKSAGMKTVGVYDEAFKEHWAQIQKTADACLYDFRENPFRLVASSDWAKE